MKNFSRGNENISCLLREDGSVTIIKIVSNFNNLIKDPTNPNARQLI